MTYHECMCDTPIYDQIDIAHAIDVSALGETNREHHHRGANLAC
jgi:hypothetical protein